MRAWWIALLWALPVWGQSWTQRGFVEARGQFFPQVGNNDRGRAIGEILLRYEMGLKLTPWLRLDGGIEARSDSHRMSERQWRVDWQDRGMLRPALSFRQFRVTANRGPWTAEVGKQFIRWGKADILNPLDRFAPRDFLNVVDTEYLGVLATRGSWEKGSETIEVVWQPRFTPSRIPLLLQRWGGLPTGSIPAGWAVRQGEAQLPSGPQWGLRWNHIGRGYEVTGVYYDGHNHLPLVDGRVSLTPTPRAEIFPYFARLRMGGGALAAPNRWFTLKAEGGYFSSSTRNADNYWQYVVQAERQWKEWTFVGGYAGEVVTARRNVLDFAPDRGLTRSFLGRASVQLNSRDTFTVDMALRQNGEGVWIRSEYSHSFRAHWSFRAAGTVIRGQDSDFLGQFQKNSHLSMAIRYSF